MGPCLLIGRFSVDPYRTVRLVYFPCFAVYFSHFSNLLVSWDHACMTLR